ncbi:MAG: flippase-like domain-containing protein [Saprospirales bacterium]|nr:flippase-like domain-containing protein [Saprospirales bacterium]
MKNFLKKVQSILKALLFFALGFSILFLLYVNQDKAWKAQCALDGIPADQCSLIDKLLTDFAGAHFGWIAVVGLFLLISHFSRTMRWLMLVRPLGYKPGFLNALFFNWSGILCQPGLSAHWRIGACSYPGPLRAHSSGKVMGTVVVDRVADGLSMFAVLGLAFLFESDRIFSLIRSLRQGSSEAGSNGASLLLILAIAGLTGLVLLWVFRKPLSRLPIFSKVVDLLKGFAQGIQTIRKLEKPHWFIFHSLNVWVMYYLMAYVGFFAFAPTAHLGPMAGLIVFAAGTLGFTVPSPGGMGTYHFMVASVLTFFYGIQKADAFSYANIIFFSIQIGFNVLFGLVSVIFLPIINRK